MVAKSEFDLLIKCLKMTTTGNDGTDLAAMRAANKQLAKLGWTWEKLLEGKVKVIADPFGAAVAPPPPPPPRPMRPAPPPPPPDPDPMWRRNPPRQTQFRQDPPRSSFRAAGTTTGRMSGKPSRPRRQAAGNITLDDLGL